MVQRSGGRRQVVDGSPSIGARQPTRGTLSRKGSFTDASSAWSSEDDNTHEAQLQTIQVTNLFTTLRNKPWLVPAEQPLQLVFFRKVFMKLLTAARETSVGENETEELDIPLMIVQRSFSRLCRLLRDDRVFDVKRYDINGDGHAGWWEFLAMWKEEQLCMRLSPMERIYLTLEDPHSSRLGWLTSVCVFSTITVSALSFVLSTLPSFQDAPACSTCEPKPHEYFEQIDLVCVVLFTMEYFARLFTSAFMRVELTNEEDLINNMTKEETLKSPTPFERMLAFMVSWPNLIDLMAILPSYLSIFTPEAGGDAGGVEVILVKVTRLMRVVRALRLGRRFEAVIIVVNTMKRSTRALWVLILNLGLGVMVWASVMFYLEEGIYDPNSGAYVRPQEDNMTTPFASIPHSFWFALVTATTVGYGDDVPVTQGGRFFAGLNMVYSLCVLALPIGVIGSNFDAVWQEFDREKRDEKNVKENAAWMLSDACLSLEPLSYSKLVQFEVLHSPPMAGKNNEIFLGQATATLALNPDSSEEVHQELVLPLTANRSRANRKATGEIKISYTWSPYQDDDPSVVLSGNLTLNIISANDLGRIDWKDSGNPDARVRMTFYPKCEGDDTTVVPKVLMTPIVSDNRSPEWGHTVEVEVLWTLDGIVNRRAEARAVHSNVAPVNLGDTGNSHMWEKHDGSPSSRAPSRRTRIVDSKSLCNNSNNNSSDVPGHTISNSSVGTNVGNEGSDSSLLRYAAAPTNGAGPVIASISSSSFGPPSRRTSFAPHHGLRDSSLSSQLWEDVKFLSESLPMLQGELNELKHDKDAILAMLGLEPLPVQQPSIHLPLQPRSLSAVQAPTTQAPLLRLSSPRSPLSPQQQAISVGSNDGSNQSTDLGLNFFGPLGSTLKSNAAANANANCSADASHNTTTSNNHNSTTADSGGGGGAGSNNVANTPTTTANGNSNGSGNGRSNSNSNHNIIIGNSGRLNSSFRSAMGSVGSVGSINSLSGGLGNIIISSSNNNNNHSSNNNSSNNNNHNMNIPASPCQSYRLPSPTSPGFSVHSQSPGHGAGRRPETRMSADSAKGRGSSWRDDRFSWDRDRECRNTLNAPLDDASMWT